MHGATTARQRVTQARGATGGDRGRKLRSSRNSGNTINSVNNNANRRSSTISVDSDTEDEDRQIVEVSESVKEVKEHVDRNEVFTITCMLSILRALSASAVENIKQDARENKDDINYTYVHNILAEMEARNPSYAEVVEARANPTDRDVRSDSANVGDTRSDSANGHCRHCHGNSRSGKGNYATGGTKNN